MKKLYVVLLCFISYSSYALSTKIAGQLTVCAYSEFKPLSYGEGLGFESNLLKKIAHSLHLKIKFYPEKIYEQLWAMPSKAYTICDVAIGGFSKTKLREEQGAVFSLPTIKFSQSLLVRANEAPAYTSITNFNNKKIGVVPGTTGAIYAIQRLKEAKLNWENIIVNYPSESELLPALQTRKIDAIARGEIGNKYQEKLNPAFKTILPRNFAEGFAIVVDKNNPELLNAINQQITQLQKQGLPELK